MMIDLTLSGGLVLGPDGLTDCDLHLSHGHIVDQRQSRVLDVAGYLVLPGIIDMHGDGFERHMAPRRGAVKNLDAGLRAAVIELAVNGITTAVLAQFYSWEGGMRGPDFAVQMMEVMMGQHSIDIRPQLRFETHMLDHYDRFFDLVCRYNVGFVVFNDHIPHAALARGKRPPRLTGQALKSGRSPEAHLVMLQDMYERSGDVPKALAALAQRLRERNVLLGSHDDHSADEWDFAQSLGVRVSEFPETLAAAEAAKGAVVMGAPNLMRGGSHKGNVSAHDLLRLQLVDALASDYHFPSPRLAAADLAKDLGWETAWALVSSGPARLLGLSDRGVLGIGKRADAIVLNPQTHEIELTISGGRIAYAGGDVVQRILSCAV